MTNEELMIPRFEVIADYPNRTFPIGAIISMGNKKIIAIEHESIKEQNIFFNHIDDFNKYPNLFKQINWFWNRKESDMPKYVKFVWKGKIDEARKVEKWLHEDEPRTTGQITGFTHESSYENGLFPRVSLNGWTPATEEEFNYFMNEVLINKNK